MQLNDVPGVLAVADAAQRLAGIGALVVVPGRVERRAGGVDRAFNLLGHVRAALEAGDRDRVGVEVDRLREDDLDAPVFLAGRVRAVGPVAGGDNARLWHAARDQHRPDPFGAAGGEAAIEGGCALDAREAVQRQGPLPAARRVLTRALNAVVRLLLADDPRVSLMEVDPAGTDRRWVGAGDLALQRPPCEGRADSRHPAGPPIRAASIHALLPLQERSRGPRPPGSRGARMSEAGGAAVARDRVLGARAGQHRAAQLPRSFLLEQFLVLAPAAAGTAPSTARQRPLARPGQLPAREPRRGGTVARRSLKHERGRRSAAGDGGAQSVEPARRRGGDGWARDELSSFTVSLPGRHRHHSNALPRKTTGQGRLRVRAMRPAFGALCALGGALGLRLAGRWAALTRLLARR